MPSSTRSKPFLPGGVFVAAIALVVGVLLLLQMTQTRSARRLAHPVISEIQAGNQHIFQDDEGDPTGWIELWNPTAQTINLAGWSLTDSFRDLHKWSFPNVAIMPGEFVVVFASGKDRTIPQKPLHTNFRLDPVGEYLALVAPRGGRIVQEFLPKYPQQIAGASFGLSPEVFGREGDFSRVKPSDLAFLLKPSPGSANTEELLGEVADTQFSHNRGVYGEPFDLEITTKTPGAEILYTVDGTVPAVGNGAVYMEPIRLFQTTVVRAAAFRTGYKPSNVDTHTYVFPKTVLDQVGEGFPGTWGIRNGLPVKADYEMDPEITGGAGSVDRVLGGLIFLPSISLVLPPDDLFGAEGIYSNPVEHGQEWERRGSFEWFKPEGGSDVKIDCGVRIQGGWSRRPEESPKHSFRLIFRREYGTPVLKHRFFAKGGPKAYRELILRAGCNNSWLHWNGAERRRGELLRDQWMRDTLITLGAPAPRGTFAHLYLNGLYWGIYNLVERPDADFLAEHFGGKAEDYDSRNGDNVLSGDTLAWDRLFGLANAGVASADAYAQISELLDVPAFIDFMIVHLYGGSADMDRASNWYAARSRRSGGRYVFIMWDGERSLESIDANSLGLDDDQCPTRLFQRLRENERFRSAFSDRVKELIGAGGALSPEEAAARYRALAVRVGEAMICESARWGDYRRDVHSYKEGPYELYTVEGHWQPEVNRLLEQYFSQRPVEFALQLRAAGLLME